MKKELLPATAVLLSLVLAAHAQTAPTPAGKMAPTGPAKTTSKMSPTRAQHSQQLGQKFVNKSHEDTSPSGVREVPVKKVAPNQK